MGLIHRCLAMLGCCLSQLRLCGIFGRGLLGETCPAYLKLCGNAKVCVGGRVQLVALMFLWSHQYRPSWRNLPCSIGSAWVFITTCCGLAADKLDMRYHLFRGFGVEAWGERLTICAMATLTHAFFRARLDLDPLFSCSSLPGQFSQKTGLLNEWMNGGYIYICCFLLFF